MATPLPPLGPAAVLVGIAFLAGIGCTTIGPGGVFTTIALYALTPATSAAVAGTAQLTFVGVGLVATAGYYRSGELTAETNYTMAAVLSATSVLGALVGVRINTTLLSRDAFGLLLGGFVVLVGLVVLYREHAAALPEYDIDVAAPRGRIVVGALGFVLGTTSSLLGVGGPVIAVPMLVVLGVGMLPALAVAQVQAVFIATFATVGYLEAGSVALGLALLVGVPQLVGAAVGWWAAHRIDPDRLTTALGLTLIAVGPILAVQ